MRQAKGENGFSLLEVTVALLVMTIIIGASFMLLNRFQQTYRYEDAYADAQRNARFAVTRLNEIIRTAGTNPTGDTVVNNWRFVEFGSKGVFPTSGTQSEGDSLRLKSDLDGDKAANTYLKESTDVIVSSENVTLRLDSTNRQIIMVDNTQNETFPLADNISALTFKDPDGARREVEVTLTAIPSGIATSDPRYREVKYTSTIRLRNRR